MAVVEGEFGHCPCTVSSHWVFGWKVANCRTGSGTPVPNSCMMFIFIYVHLFKTHVDAICNDCNVSMKYFCI